MNVKEKVLTWEELANYYDKYHKGGRPARTLLMDKVLDWAIKRKDLFYVNKNGYICLKEACRNE